MCSSKRKSKVRVNSSDSWAEKSKSPTADAADTPCPSFSWVEVLENGQISKLIYRCHTDQLCQFFETPRMVKESQSRQSCFLVGQSHRCFNGLWWTCASHHRNSHRSCQKRVNQSILCLEVNLPVTSSFPLAVGLAYGYLCLFCLLFPQFVVRCEFSKETSHSTLSLALKTKFPTEIIKCVELKR